MLIGSQFGILAATYCTASVESFDGGFDRKKLRAASDVFLDRIVLHLQDEIARRVAMFLGERDEPGDRDRPYAIAGREDVADLVERNAVEHDLYIAQRGERDADRANLVHCKPMIEVEPDLGGQIECDRHARRLSLRHQIAIALVGVLRRTEAGVHFNVP